MSNSRPLYRYVIMHAENAYGHPYRLSDIDLNMGIYWKKGGVFVTRKGAEDYARDNCIENTYRIVEVDRRKE